MKQWLRNHRGTLLFLFCIGLFRTAIADWNPVPTGSMRPTILEGDVVLVNRLAYDLKVPLTDVSLARLGEPQRGDVVTFSSPKDGQRLIKRIVALPGDTVALRDNVLYVNGERAEYSDPFEVSEPIGTDRTAPAVRLTETFDERAHRVQYIEDARTLRDFGPVTVPAEHYFMLGDNRDNSADSRYIGFVPRKLLIGRAGHILVSADIKHGWTPRFDRSFSVLD